MTERFTVIYPDGSKGKVTAEQHKQMLREGLLRPLDNRRSRYTGDAFHFRTLADLRVFHTAITSTVRFKNYPGLFIWLHEHRRFKETLEPPESMAARLRATGAVE